MASQTNLGPYYVGKTNNKFIIDHLTKSKVNNNLNWTDILNDRNLVYMKIIDSFLFYKISSKPESSDDLKKYFSNAKIVANYNLLFRVNVSIRNKYLSVILSNVKNIFECKNGKIIEISKLNNFKLILMNMKFGRINIAKKLGIELENLDQIFSYYCIYDKNRKNEFYKVSYINEYLKDCKNKKRKLNLPLMHKKYSYFEKTMENYINKKKFFLTHCFTKMNFDLRFIISIDRYNNQMKFKKDSNNYTAFDYYLINKNNPVLDKLFDKKIYESLNRKFFSSCPLLDLYLGFRSKPVNIDKISTSTVMKILDFDKNNLENNIYKLLSYNKILCEILEKTKTKYTKTIIKVFLSGHYLHWDSIAILIKIVKNNLIDDTTFKKYIDNLVIRMLTDGINCHHEHYEQNHLSSRIELNMKFLLEIFADRRFNNIIFIKNNKENFLVKKQNTKFYITKKHCIYLIEKLFDILGIDHSSSLKTSKKNKLIDILFSLLMKNVSFFRKRKKDISYNVRKKIRT